MGNSMVHMLGIHCCLQCAEIRGQQRGQVIGACMGHPREGGGGGSSMYEALRLDDIVAFTMSRFTCAPQRTV